MPDAGLTLLGSTLYGTTVDGGTNNHGTVFSLTLPSSTLLGDLNRDNQFNALDLKAMLTAVTDLKAYKSGNYYTSDADFLAVADLNGDGKVNNADIQALLNKLKSGTGSAAAVPEPVTMQLLLAAPGHRRRRLSRVGRNGRWFDRSRACPRCSMLNDDAEIRESADINSPGRRRTPESCIRRAIDRQLARIVPSYPPHTVVRRVTGAKVIKCRSMLGARQNEAAMQDGTPAPVDLIPLKAQID